MTAKTLFYLAYKSLAWAYGVLSMGAFLLLALTRKNSFRKLDAQAKKELAYARDKLWNLNNHPNNLNHRFCVLRSGVKLHYVESAPREIFVDRSLVIFIHGFPDSWVLWQHYLRNQRLSKHATLVAVDLPGFGGSDNSETYGPTGVMEAMAEFVLKMREQYLTGDNGRVVIVSHDWGALVTFRLAVEAPNVADRFIMSNCVHPALAESNVRTRIGSAREMARTWIHSPLNIRPLQHAASNIYPILRQIFKSSYIFIFNLPYPLSSVVGNVGDFWFFRYLNAISSHPDPPKPLEGSHGAEMLANSVGPSVEECSVAVDGSKLAYSAEVRERAQSGGWREKIRLYQDGLAFKPWEKSLELLWELHQLEQALGRRRSSSGNVFDAGPKGSLRAPVTVLWGKSDLAFENAIAVEGLRDYFGVKSSHLVMISRCGHWSPVDQNGTPIFDEVIEWAVAGEKGSLRDKLGDDFPLAQIVAER